MILEGIVICRVDRCRQGIFVARQTVPTAKDHLQQFDCLSIGNKSPVGCPIDVANQLVAFDDAGIEIIGGKRLAALAKFTKGQRFRG